MILSKNFPSSFRNNPYFSKNTNYSVNYYENKTNPSFCRALSTKELTRNAELISMAKEKLGIDRFAMTLFQAAAPSKAGENPGIGTIYSKYVREMIKTFRKLTGMDSVLVGPDGLTSNRCPYSGSSGPVNPRLIDLSSLTTPEYGSILKSGSKKLAALFGNKGNENNEYRVAFDHIGKFFEPVLEEAHGNFKKLCGAHPLKLEYAEFLKKHEEKLDRYSLFHALSKEHGNENCKSWSELDQELFGKSQGTDKAKARINELKSQHKNDIDFFKFCQFITQKQHFETKQDLGDIKLLGDCLVGFSERDLWANKSAFEEGRFIGLPGQLWGFPLLKDTPEADEIARAKFRDYFERYPNLRGDAFWAHSTPMTYRIDPKTGKDVDWQFSDKGSKYVDMFMEEGRHANGENWNPNHNMLELLCGPGESECLDNVQRILNDKYRKNGVPMPEIGLTVYGGFADQQPSVNWVTIGTHDCPSALNAVEGDTGRLTNWFAGLLKGPVREGRGAGKVSLMFADVLGMSERYNDFTKPADNWALRIPPNCEEFYHKQLANGYGFNGPEVFKKALISKFPETNRPAAMQALINELDKHSQILKDKKGPFTTAEADKLAL